MRVCDGVFSPNTAVCLGFFFSCLKKSSIRMINRLWKEIVFKIIVDCQEAWTDDNTEYWNNKNNEKGQINCKGYNALHLTFIISFSDHWITWVWTGIDTQIPDVSWSRMMESSTYFPCTVVVSPSRHRWPPTAAYTSARLRSTETTVLHIPPSILILILPSKVKHQN